MDFGDRGLVTVFGGSGFIGKQAVAAIARLGYRVRVAVRRPDLAGEVRLSGPQGRVQPVQANVRNPDSVARACAGADIVVNLAGIFCEKGRQRFMAVNAVGAGHVAEAALAAGAGALVHLSALAADPEAKSACARSKALGETEILKVFPGATILRPSLVFGRDDSFFNRIGERARLFPLMPVIGTASLFQPVFVGDVAAAIAAAVNGAARPGTVYELGGPETETLAALVARVLVETDRRRPLMPTAPLIARLCGHLAQLLPSKPFCADRIALLQADHVVSDMAIAEKRTLSGLGIAATSMDAILPTYLWRFRRHGQFERIEPKA
jgi:NADH dehydrogenase